MIIVHIAGHLGADVETRVTPDGRKVSTIRVATRVRRGGRDDTVWWRVTLWGDEWDKMLPYLVKGAGVIVVGDMSKPEIYNARDGQPQISLDIRADIVKFSPFGRPDRQQGEGQQQGMGAPQPAYGAPLPPQQPTIPSPYGRPPAESSAGLGNSFDAVPEEDIPF